MSGPYPGDGPDNFLLSWPAVIDISANTAGEITVIETNLVHRVIVDVSASTLGDVSGLGASLEWYRKTGSTAPYGRWLQPAEFFFSTIAGRPVVDFDPTEDASGNIILTFTTSELDPNFKRGTANDLVIPYVLFRLFGTSKVSSATVPNYTKLTTDPNDPLLDSATWINAFNTEIVLTDASGTPADTMFRELLQDVGRFKDASDNPLPALYTVDPWAGTDVSGSGIYPGNPWQLHAGDIMQFTTKFTFANSISVKSTSTISPDSVPQAIILAGETYYIRYQVRIVAG